MLSRFTLAQIDYKGKIKGKNHSNLMFWFWETNCCKCEFTNELRIYREDIQIVYNHLAVKNPLYFLSYRSYIQSAVGVVSERLSCFVAHMESLILPGVHFVGEVLDVDGQCGGYNLAFAFVSGYVAGKNI